MSPKKSGSGIFLIILGGWFLGIGSILLVAGEIFSAKTSDMLKEIPQVLVEAGDLATADPALEGQVIHAVGQATTDEVLSDLDWGFRINAIFLKRNALYYQIVEKSYEEVVGEDSEGDDITETVYYYENEWVNHPVKSGNFYDRDLRGENYTILQIDTTVTWARDVRFGAYRLSEKLVRQMTARTGADVGEIDPDILSAWNEKALQALHRRNGTLVRPNGRNIYIGDNPDKPHIGDVRVSFDVVLPQEVSLLTGVAGDSLYYYYGKRRARVAYLKQGNHDADALLQDQGMENRETEGLGRVMGFLHILLGIWLLLKGFDRRPDPAEWIQTLSSGRHFLTALALAFGWTFGLASLPWFFFGSLWPLLFLGLGAAIIGVTYIFLS